MPHQSRKISGASSDSNGGGREFVPKRARFDRNRVETVRCEKESIPKPPPEKVALAAKIDPEKKPAKSCEPFSFLDRLRDEHCSTCEPPPSCADRLPEEWRHTPWDEIEMKKHSLLDRKCRHSAGALLADEVEMKKRGLVDSEGHHVSRALDDQEKRKAAEAAARARERLEIRMLEKAIKEKNDVREIVAPRIKICRAVDVVGEDEGDQVSSPPSSQTMLTVRRSGASSPSTDSIGPPFQEGKKKFVPGARWRSSSPRSSLAPELTFTPDRSGSRAGASPQPVVISNSFETEGGRFELNLTIRVNVKPKSTEAAIDAAESRVNGW